MLTIKEAQTIQILEFMRAGNSITPLDALRKFGCMRLGARIYDLKQDEVPLFHRLPNAVTCAHRAVHQPRTGLGVWRLMVYCSMS
ncbi:helix-turn-helix domain-containing protein [Snodgrassella alvi]|uniref:helix-turn-helix domain-containing protein n=1 Tax=Snodgrassella alvi TaxID=1196083 RepID=UPI0034E86EE6